MNKELIERLRGYPTILTYEAADALESQAAEIEALAVELIRERETCTEYIEQRNALAAIVQQQRDALNQANEQLIGWRKSFPNYADSEEVARQIEEALDISLAEAILAKRDAEVLRQRRGIRSTAK